MTTARNDLFRIVRSKEFLKIPPAERTDFIVGYLQSQQPSEMARAGFAQFDKTKQRQIAQEATRRISQETPGETFQRSAETAGPIAGAFAGAQIGAPFGPIGVAVGGAGGALSGVLAPALLRPLTTGQGGQLGEDLEEAGFAGLLGLAGGVVEKGFKAAGQFVGNIRSNVFVRRFRDLKTGKKIEDPAVTAAREVLEPRGGALTAGQQRGTGRGFFETVAQGSIIGEGNFANMAKANEAALDQFADEIAKNIGRSMPAEQLGVFFRNQLVAGGNVARAVGKKLFGQVDEAAGGIRVDQDDALAFLVEKHEIPAMKKVFAAFTAGRQGGLRGAQELLGLRTGRFASFENADLAASEFFAVSRQLGKQGETGAANLAKVLGTKIRGGIDDALDTLDPELKTMANNARQFWKENVVETFETDVMRGVLKKLHKTPGQLPKMLLNGGIDTLKAVKKVAQLSQKADKPSNIAAEVPTWPEIQRSVMGSLLAKSTDPVAGIFNNIQKVSGQTLMTQVRALDAGNSGFIKTLTDGSVTLKDFQRLANAIDVANRKIGGSGGIMIKMSQGGAIGGLLTLGATGVMSPGMTVAGSGTIIFAPWLLARWFNNKQAMVNLGDGLIGGPLSAGFRRLTTAAILEGEKMRSEVQGKLPSLGLRDAPQSIRELIQTGGPPLVSPRPLQISAARPTSP